MLPLGKIAGRAIWAFCKNSEGVVESASREFGMSDGQKPVISQDHVGALVSLLRTARLVWRLVADPRVPLFPKLILLVAAIYVISPVDLIPDLILGLGQLDDIGVAMLAIGVFIQLCPPAVVDEHRRAIAGESGPSAKPPDDETIEGSFRVMSDDDPTHK
jgi:uncharacterized membrane protein YkvA (DUF1232 family)